MNFRLKDIVYPLYIRRDCLLMMKLVTLFLVIGLVQVMAKGYGQRITIKEHGVSMEDIFRIVESRSNYYFIYDKRELPVEKNVHITIENGLIEDVLQQVLKDEPLDYKVFEHTIVIRKRHIPMRDQKISTPVAAIPQPNMIQGKVTDPSGHPLGGVGVFIKHTKQGTSTDDRGNFSLETNESQVTLVFSYLGFTTQEFPVTGNQVISVQLTPQTNELEEMVVVGYGTQKKVNLTGAVDVISDKQIRNRQSATVSQILQGQSPGLNFSINDQGFQPGASMDVNIRGIGSLNGGSPLVLIDGFPGSMDRLNPSDIESISVLKDAAASAIYGARAPYGVILITTKSGVKNEKMSISYTANISMSVSDRLPQMLDSYTFARVVNEMGDNAGGRPYTDEAIERILAYRRGDMEFLKQFMPNDATHFETVVNAASPNRWGSNNMGYADYNWYDEWYGASLNQQHNLSVSGGSAKTSYFLSAGYTGQEGVLNYGTDYYKRFNLTGKMNTAITDWLDVSYEARFMKSPREHFNGKKAGGYEGLFREIPRTVPTQAKYDGYGNWSMESKIPWAEEAGTDRLEFTENWQILGAEIRPANGWRIKGDFAYRAGMLKQQNIDKAVIEHYLDGSLVPHGETLPSQAEQIHEDNYYWSANLYTSYDTRINEMHSFSATLGTQYEYDNTSRMVASRINLIVPEVPSLSTANGDPVVSQTLGHWSTLGYFGRLNYNYDEKYLVEVNGRYDGTSRFREGMRWGFFPSLSAGWNLDKEAFWKGVRRYVNTLKIRGSWGQLGNQQVSPYLDLPLIPIETAKLNWLFNYGENRPVGYTGTPALISPNLTWETAITKNLGWNASFLNGRLAWDVDLFERVTENMIGPSEPVPGVLGVAVPRSNNATLRTRGWETSVRWNHAVSDKFSYFVTANLSDARSYVSDYLNPTGLISDWYAGKEVGEIWGFTVDKLYQSQEELDAYLKQVDLSNIFNTWRPGDVKYEDINKDGKVNRGANTVDNPGDQSIIGNNTPRYQYGISAGLTLKNIDFSFLIKGTAKRDYAVPVAGEQYVYWGVQNWLFTALQPVHMDYFRDTPGNQYSGLHEGDANINLQAFWPRLYMDANQNRKNREVSTRYLMNAAYLRLQHVQLGYTPPQTVMGKLGLQNMRVFISGENLFTLTSLIRGIDPVALDGHDRVGMTYRADRIFSIGINASLQ